jgi:hypothetical protein
MEKLNAFRNPSLTRNVNPVAEPAKWKVVPIEGKGMGVVATKIIRRGEMVMANTASAVLDYSTHQELTQEDILRLQALTVDSLPTYNRQTVLNQSTHYGVNLTHEQLVDRVIGINVFAIEMEHVINSEDTLVGVFPAIARLNHDCRPNTIYYFDDDRFTQFVYAARDIMPGEELSDSYIDIVQSQRQRARSLKNWGFKCSCAACTADQGTIRASDLRVEQIKSLSKELNNHGSDSRASPQMAELLISLVEQEKMYEEMASAYRHAAVEWNGVGEPWTATKYAHLAIEFGLFTSGSGSEYVEDMRDLAEDPWGHSSWMRRTRTRQGWDQNIGSRGVKRMTLTQVDDDDDDNE